VIDCAVESIERILADPTIGVDAVLPTVPRRVGDTLPATVEVFTELDDANTARDVAAANVPAGTIVIQISESETPASLTEQGTYPIPPDARLDVLVRIVLSLEGTQPYRKRLLALAYRAVMRSLRMAFEQQHSALEVRRVRLLRWESSVFREVYNQAGSGPTTGAMVLTLQARDHFTNLGPTP
jgi:hypothetical protein